MIYTKYKRALAPNHYLKTHCFFLLLLLFLQLNGLSQPQTTYVIRGGESHAVTYFSNEKSIRQQWLNPYLDENWQSGRIVLNDSIQWEAQLRLDLYRREMELVINGDSMYVSEPFQLRYLEIGDRTFVYRFYTEKVAGDLLLSANYFEQLNQKGPVLLLLRRRLRVDEQRMAPGNVQLAMKFETKTIFAVENHYFLQIGNEALPIKINRNKRQLLRLLADERSALKRYAAQNRKNFRKPEHLAAIIDYYNQLKTIEAYE